jgi:hypothetical protein
LGVHVSVYAEKAGLTEVQIASLVTGGPDDCWADEDRVLIRLRDDLQHCTVDDEIWTQLTAHPATRRSRSCSCWRAPTGPCAIS